MKLWTKQEIDYLSDNWGYLTIPKIAENLGRSVQAVKLKAQRTGLHRHIHSGCYITVNQLATAINHSYSIVINWEKYGLEIKKKKSINKFYKIIKIEDFWEWAKNHKQLVHFDRIEPLILGEEPEWVQEARRADFNGKTSRAKWTSNDNDRLIYMLNQYRYSVSEIATALNRTEGAVKRHILDLGLKQRPIRQEDRKWTEDQINTLLDMVERGYNFEQIGKCIGRTGSAIRGKYEQLINPKYMKQQRKGCQIQYMGVSWRERSENKCKRKGA